MVSRSSTNSTSSLATKRSVITVGKANGFFAGQSHQWVIELPFRCASTQDQLSLPGEFALHFLVHLLVLNARPAHLVGMFCQNFADFLVQAVLDADLVLHRGAHALRESCRLSALQSFWRRAGASPLRRPCIQRNRARAASSMSPEEFGKAVYCPARRSVKEGSHGPAKLPQ